MKDIGKYLDFHWSVPISGLQSVVLREEWELGQSESLKQQLILYNLDDCLALRKITEFIYTLILKKHSEDNPNNSEIIFADDMKLEAFYRWGNVNFFYPEFDFINKCAYFDYQREKVYARTNKKLRKTIKKVANKKHFTADKQIELKALRCRVCKSFGLEKYPQRTETKTVFDLKFSKNGVKKWIINYSASEYSCLKRKHVFYPRKFSNLRMYAHNLKVWCVYQYVINRISQEEIQRYINDLFGFNVNYPRIHDMRSKLAKYYKGTYQEIIKRIVSSNVIYADETHINLMNKSGYVWVLTNMEETFFLYKETREGSFLKELLKDFKGVLVSDFYSAYDSLECEQQKCLIHLIRDLNGDLHANPYDEELKLIAKEFSLLLKKIVETIDTYGLKRRHLNKHHKDVNKFFKKIINNEFHSEKAIHYQKRFRKNKEKLFTFLNHDGVTWNNNNAENAIKHIAKWRRLVSGIITQSSIEDYCIFISI